MSSRLTHAEYLKRFARTPEGELTELSGPPHPWDLYSVLAAMSRYTLSSAHQFDRFQFDHMLPADRVALIESLRTQVVNAEILEWIAQSNERARLKAIEDADARIEAAMGERLGAW